MSDGADVILIDGLEVFATNEYQTSLLLELPHAPERVVYVELVRVPLVLLQEVDELSEIALHIKSFPGCAKQNFGKKNIAEKISERNIFLKPKQYFISGQSWLFK